MGRRVYLLLLICLAFTVVAQETKIVDYVNDYSGVLSPDEELQLEGILQHIHESGKAEYAIVIVDSLEGQDIESSSLDLAQGVLGDKDLNNGLLLLIALNDRQYRFEVGRGIEDQLPDVTVARIGREHLEPNFQNGDYYQGILAATDAVEKRLSGQELPEEDDGLKTAIIIFIILIIIIILILVFASKNSVSKTRRKDDDYFSAAWILSQMFKGGGGGGSSGGFGGFGGGSFGGGGSSGRW